MAYVVVRVVICDAFREPDKPYQVLPGGKVQAQGRAAVLCPIPGVARISARSCAPNGRNFDDPVRPCLIPICWIDAPNPLHAA
jgi:hypothetical protein